MAFENIHTKYQAKAKLPGPGELAEMIRDGLTVDEVADLFDAAPGTVQAALNNGGYRNDGTAHTQSSDEQPEVYALFRPLPWADRAVCAQTDPELFYPEKGGDAHTGRALCQSCPVAAECLDYALDNNEQFGIWGGLTAHDRRELRRAHSA